MANKKQIKLLRQIEDWNKWRTDNPDVRINLSRADFWRADLYRVDLGGANLSYSILIKANLRKANLEGANLSRADLSGADLEGAYLRKAYLSGADLRGANLRGANLEGANLSKTDLSKANFYVTNLIGANLSEADLSEAGLIGAKLLGANLNKVNFGGINIHEIDLRGTNICEDMLRKDFNYNHNFSQYVDSEIFKEDKEQLSRLDQEQLKRLKKGVKFWNKWRQNNIDVNIYLNKVDLVESYLRRANLWRAKLSGSDLRKTDLIEANLREADLRRVNFKGADLRDSDLREADLRGANLIKAKLNEANLIGADLREADLRGSNLIKAKLIETNLIETNLSGTNLSYSNLREANLINTNFTNSTITGVNLYGNAKDNWIIDGIKCDYFYNDLKGKNRLPKEGNFKEGAFEELYKQLPTFEYLFEKGFTPIDPLIMDQVVQVINEKRPEIELRLDSFHSKGQPRAVFTVLHKHDVEETQKQIAYEYEKKIIALEGKNEILKELVITSMNKPQQHIERLITMGDNINFGGNGNIAFAKDNADVRQTNINYKTNNELLTEINKLKNELSKISVDQTNREAIEIQFETLENNARSDKKNAVLMKTTLESIKSITQGALGSAMGAGFNISYKF